MLDRGRDGDGLPAFRTGDDAPDRLVRGIETVGAGRTHDGDGQTPKKRSDLRNRSSLARPRATTERHPSAAPFGTRLQAPPLS